MLKTNIELFVSTSLRSEKQLHRFINLEIDGDRLGMKVSDNKYKLSEDRSRLEFKGAEASVIDSINPMEIRDIIMELIPSGAIYSVNEVDEIVSIVENHFNKFNKDSYTIK